MGQEFAAPPEAYDHFMGRYSRELAPVFADAAGLVAGAAGVTGDGAPRVVDVGCGPGVLAAVLGERFGGDHVAAIDPAAQFVAACEGRVPGVDARVGPAEELPWDDDTFDAALGCLVLGFMRDPARGVAEMARVTRPGGVVAHCFWSLPAGLDLFRAFWGAYGEVTGRGPADAGMYGTAPGQIADCLVAGGLADVAGGTLEVTASYADFTELWASLSNGVGPPGQALLSCTDDQRAAIRELLLERLAVDAGAPFSLRGRAWWARGTVL